MKGDGWTAMGGPDGGFHTTVWSDVLQAQTEDPARCKAAMENLLTRYWKPVYAYIRKKGCSNEDAKDATQDFFCQLVAGGGPIKTADPSKGRFRAYLRKALDWYLAEAHGRRTAKKRAPAGPVISLEGAYAAGLPQTDAGGSPADAFDYEWALTLLDETLSELETEYCGSERAAYWHVFSERVVEPIMRGADPPPLPALCTKYSIKNEATASNMLTTAKRRYRAILRRRVSELVGSDDEIDGEIQELTSLLSKGRAGS